MKTFFKTFIITVGLLVSLSVFGDSIPTEGTWDNKGVRSLIPPPPSASIEVNTLSIFMAKPLVDLTVKVVDSIGNVVHEECISSYENNFTYNIQLDAPSGEYHLVMIHRHGTLFGTFNIE